MSCPLAAEYTVIETSIGKLSPAAVVPLLRGCCLLANKLTGPPFTKDNISFHNQAYCRMYQQARVRIRSDRLQWTPRLTGAVRPGVGSR